MYSYSQYYFRAFLYYIQDMEDIKLADIGCKTLQLIENNFISQSLSSLSSKWLVYLRVFFIITF